MSKQKQKRDLEAIAAAYGFVFAGHTARGHLRWHGPDGELVITVATMGDPCALRNTVALFRRPPARIHDQETQP